MHHVEKQEQKPSLATELCTLANFEEPPHPTFQRKVSLHWVIYALILLQILRWIAVLENLIRHLMTLKIDSMKLISHLEREIAIVQLQEVGLVSIFREF